MAITTLDGAIAGFQYPRALAKNVTPTLVAGRPHSLFYLAGYPGAAANPSPGAAGAALTTYAGQIPFSNPVSGNTYLARFGGQATISGKLMLLDRLWHNSGLVITQTTAQTVNSAAWPARDVAGTTNGDGVLIGLEVFTATGAGAPVFSMSYTNQAGTAGKTGAGLITGVASSAIGAFYQMGLAAGDTGVRSIQTFTASISWTSGAYSLVAYRVLAEVDLSAANVPTYGDLVTLGMPRMYDNSVPFVVFVPSTTTASNISGTVVYTQG